MKLRDIPTYLAKTIYEVPVDFFLSRGIKILLCDLDNTLLPYGQSEPSQEAIALKERLDQAGISLVVCSNALGERVKRFSSLLGIEAFGMMRKPLKGPLLRLIKGQGWDKDALLFVGDQIQTDIKAGNGAGLKTMLTEPFPCKEPIWTRFHRLFEKSKRKKILEKHLTPYWKEA